HDRAIGSDEQAERCAFFAFDRPLVGAIVATAGAEVAKIVEGVVGAGAGMLGEDLLARVTKGLRALGDKPLAEAEPAARPDLLRAVELLVLSSGRVFAGGDRVDYWDGRVLPLLSIGGGDPVIEDDDLEALAAAESSLHALVEIVPSASPPGGAG